MFKHTVTQVNGRLTALSTQALALLKELRCKLVSSLPARFIRVYQNVVNLYLLNLLRVPTGSNTSHLRVSLITAGQLIKAALTSVKAKAIRLGQQLLTIVLPINPVAPTAQSPKKGRPVGSTKSDRSRSKESKTAPTLTARLLTPVGLKLQGLVSQLRQLVTQTSKKGK